MNNGNVASIRADELPVEKQIKAVHASCTMEPASTPNLDFGDHVLVDGGLYGALNL